MDIVDELPSLRQRLRSALTDAMRARDKVAVSVLRTTIAAVDNAEAVEVAAPLGGSMLAIEMLPIGAGAAEAERRVLTVGDVEAIVRAEVDERLRAADGYVVSGHGERAEALRVEAAVLSALLDG